MYIAMPQLKLQHFQVNRNQKQLKKKNQRTKSIDRIPIRGDIQLK